MSIYTENKNFCNKFKAILEDGLKRHGEYTRNLEVPFKNDSLRKVSSYATRVGVNLKYVPVGKIEFAEVGKSMLFFCVRLKETSRMVRYTESSDINKMAARAFVTGLSIYSTPNDYLDEIKRYLIKTYNDKNEQGVAYSTLDKSYIIRGLKDANGERLVDFPDVRDFAKDLKTFMDTESKIYRHPKVYKNIKDRELIPIAYYNNEGYLYVSSGGASNHNTSGAYDKFHVGGVGGREIDLRRKGNAAASYANFDEWSVFEINTPVIDEKEYNRINFQI